MKRSIGIAIMLALFMGATMPARAGGESEPEKARPPIPDAEKIIAACTEKFRADYDSGVTSRMRAAGIDDAMCVSDAVVENMVILAGEKKRAAIVRQLDLLNTGTGGFYWTLYNEIEPCFRGRQPGCGTMNQVMHNAKVREVYRKMLRDTIRKRQEHNW